jgi:hypothetical protein
MLGLILESLKVSGKRMERLALKKIAALALAFVLFACAWAWATTALYMHICQWLTPVQSSLLISVSALLLGLLCLFLSSTRRPKKQADNELVQILIAALAQNSSSKQDRLESRRGSSLPETALIAAIVGAIVYGGSRR